MKTKLLTLFVLLSTFCFAIERGPCDQAEACCQEPQNTFAFSYPKDINLSCPRDFDVHGDFLWMNHYEGGLEYAASLQKVIDSNHSNVKFRPGFRVGMSALLFHDEFKLNFDWTYIRIKSRSQVSANAPILMTAFLPPSLLNLSSAASSLLSGDFNTFDLSFSKPYHVSRHFIATPTFGVRYAWIDQDYLIRFSYNDIKNKFIAKNNYWGVGLRAGYEGIYSLFGSFQFYGKAYFSLLFSKFDVSQSSDLVTALNTLNVNLKDDFYIVEPNAELAFGLKWGKYFNQNRYLISLNLGFEFHQWWDQNQLRKPFDAVGANSFDTVARGDLRFNGFVFGLNLDF